jgi:RNA polymerase sigma-70 factor (ECF subfamily)
MVQEEAHPLAQKVVDLLPELIAYAIRAGCAPQDARDLVQTAATQAWQAIRAGTRPLNLRAWLYRITHHAFLKRRRRESLWRRLLPRLARAEPPDALDASEGLLEAIRGLKHPLGSILLLRFVQGLSYSEIAEVLDLPPANVKVYAGRALSRLHDQLREEKP